MIFWIILLIILLTGFITVIVIHNTQFDCEGWMMIFGFLLLLATIVFSILMVSRKANISSYYEAKEFPEYFSNAQRINDNEIIAKIKAYQGTIFSFYNGIDFEYFEIEDGNKIIINEGAGTDD